MSETGVTGQPDIQAVTFTPAHYSAAPLGPLQPSSMTSGPRTAPSGPGSWSSPSVAAGLGRHGGPQEQPA